MGAECHGAIAIGCAIHTPWKRLRNARFDGTGEELVWVLAYKDSVSAPSRFGPFSLLVGALVGLGACGHGASYPVTKTPTPTPTLRASVTPSAPPLPSASSVVATKPAAPWGLAYRRSCTSSITAPVLSLDGATVSSCGANFGADKGRFLGPAPSGLLARLPEDRAVTDEYGNGGLAVVSSDGSVVRDPGGRPSHVALSPDGARIVSLEGRSLYVREVPSLRRVRVTELGPGPSGGTVGFLADGREAVFASYPCVPGVCRGTKSTQSCDAAKCSGPGLFAVDHGTLALVSPALTELEHVALSNRGDTAVIVRHDHTAALVALPSGAVVAKLPSLGDEHGRELAVSALAVSAEGDRVAVATEGELRIFGREGGTFIELFASATPAVSSLTFAADGRSLYTGHALAVYREGATPHALTVPRYSPDLPAGFERLERRGDVFVSANHPDGERSAEGLSAVFEDQRQSTTITVRVHDSEELDGSGDAAAWGGRVATRLFPGLPLATEAERSKVAYQTWGDARGGRSMALHQLESGCETVETFHRVLERDGVILHVEISTLGRLKKDRMEALRKAALDGPLGAAPAPEAPGRQPSSAHAHSHTKPPKHPHKHARPKAPHPSGRR